MRLVFITQGRSGIAFIEDAMRITLSAFFNTEYYFATKKLNQSI